jgi:hypothetical protein
MFDIVDKLQERGHPVGTYLPKSEGTQEPDEATNIFSWMHDVAIRLSYRKQHHRAPHLSAGLNNEIHFPQHALHFCVKQC